MMPIPCIAQPILIAWPRDEAAHSTCQWEIWWVTTILQAGHRRLAAQAVITHPGNGGVAVMLTLTDLADDRELTRTTFTAQDGARLSSDALNVEAQDCSFRGAFADGYRLQASLQGGAGFDLFLRPTRPVLHNGGVGMFMLQGTPTLQYSIGGLAVSGTVRLDGQELAVAGHGWHDRQWEMVKRDGQLRFTWFGICLDNDDTISFWNPDGGSGWVTLVRPDGTHIVAAAEAVPADIRPTRLGRAVPRRWTLAIPSMRARLEVTQIRVMDSERLYTGAVTVEGDYDGGKSHGYGFCDMVAPLGS